MQLGHSGRKASVKSAMHDWAPLGPDDAARGKPPWVGVSPSPLPAAPGKHIPKEMDTDDMRIVIDAFKEATRRTADAGFEILEIRRPRLSPASVLVTTFQFKNGQLRRRFRGRMRFVLEVTEAVRDAWPKDLPLFFRVSSVDGKGGVWNMDDTELSKAVKNVA